MGIGDEIMITGEVKRRAAGTARRFAIKDVRKGHMRWDAMWEGNPRIAVPGDAYDEVLEMGPGNRPYIAAKNDRAWVFKRYGPTPGEIFLNPTELAFVEVGRGSVVISPWLKPAASPNKMWPHWERLVRSAPDVPWLQIGPPGARVLPGARFVSTLSFRQACGILAGARAAVLHEGGLHHAAAALGTPAVVIFGGYITPEVTGYECHRNLHVPDGRWPWGCGMRVACPHCLRAMEGISTKDVKKALEGILNGATNGD